MTSNAERAAAFLAAEDELRAARADLDRLVADQWQANAEALAMRNRLSTGLQVIRDSRDRVGALRRALFDLDYSEHATSDGLALDAERDWVNGYPTYRMPGAIVDETKNDERND